MTPPRIADLHALPLRSIPGVPTRVLSWAERNQVTSLGEIVAFHPAQAIQERNLGRGSISNMRRAISRATGQTWEALHALVTAGTQSDLSGAPPSALRPQRFAKTRPEGAAPPTDWDQVLGWLGDDASALPLSAMDLPARMKSYCERQGLETLEQLFSRSSARMMSEPNIGRGTLRDTVGTLASYPWDTLESSPSQDAEVLQKQFPSPEESHLGQDPGESSQANRVAAAHAPVPRDAQTLREFQRHLRERFTDLRDSRRGAVFFVEHGLRAVELHDLRANVRASLHHHPLEAEWWDQHDLALLVVATEVGYWYQGSGTDFWPRLEEELGLGLPAERRQRIRDLFMRASERYRGARPANTPWAQAFHLIAWPITHALLPVEFHRPLALTLANLR
ncbi:MAG: hypothetical protein KC492_26295, partial [Myxococcales bacterium]|nr:hypothetical protein [Myxococcales bacterium]